MELFLLIIAITVATGASWAVLDVIEVLGRRRKEAARPSRPRVPSRLHPGREVRS